MVSSSCLRRLYSYGRGADALLYGGMPHLLSMTQSGGSPDITFCWVPHESLSTVHMDVPPDQFIFGGGQRYGWRGDLAQDSQTTSEARCLCLVNETRTVMSILWCRWSLFTNLSNGEPHWNEQTTLHALRSLCQGQLVHGTSIVLNPRIKTEWIAQSHEHYQCVSL